MLAALVLGAGLSTRMGKQKLLLPFGSQTLIECTLLSIRERFKGVIVVITTETVYKAIGDTSDFYYKINEHPEKGQALSLKLGVEAVAEHCPECEGIMVFLADQPFVSSACIADVARELKGHPNKIIVPEYQGKPGHPVVFGKNWFRALTEASGDQGGRGLIKTYPEAVIRIPGDFGCTLDIDTQGDYEKALEKRFNQ
ncbi:MAG: nucleotidyltransferase family protein [Eubacterium sp.]